MHLSTHLSIKSYSPLWNSHLLMYGSNVLDNFCTWLASFWPIFVLTSLKASAILGLLKTSTLLIVSLRGRFVDFIFYFPIISSITFLFFLVSRVNLSNLSEQYIFFAFFLNVLKRFLYFLYFCAFCIFVFLYFEWWYSNQNS